MGILSIFQDIYSYAFTKNNPQKPNLGEDVRLLVQSSDFEKHLQSSLPFLITGLISWPSYWLYRGLDWHRVRNEERLRIYIKKTFYRAKVIEFAIIFAGIAMAVGSAQKSFNRQLDVQNMVEKK